MRWAKHILFLLELILALQFTLSENTETTESITSTSTTVNIDVSSNDIASSSEHNKLDANLRSALLKALTELENDDSSENPFLDEAKNIEKARASSIAIVTKTDSTNEQSVYRLVHSNATQLEKENSETTKTLSSRDTQKNDDNDDPGNSVDPAKSSEVFVTSSSNNFVSDENRSPVYIKLASSNSFNSITEPEKPSKSLPGEKSSIQNEEENKQIETTTVAIITSSTEENEAKVEQVQFFSAPLVAAFTVHQDEQGQPKKVEPIFKSSLDPIKQESKGEARPVVPRSQQPQQQPQSQQQQKQQPQQQQQLLQSPEFNNFDLKKKQQILELELANIRNQQTLQDESLKLRNSNPSFTSNSFPSFNQNSNFQSLLQNGFNQGKTQHFKQLEPVFSEPDRSIVTKLASVDPEKLLDENAVSILNKFNPNNFQSNIKNSADVSFLPSVSFNPLVEARNTLPVVQSFLLPNKEKSSKFRPNQIEGFNTNFNNIPISLPTLSAPVNFHSNNQNFLPSSNLIPPNIRSNIAKNTQVQNTNNFPSFNNPNQNLFLRQEPINNGFGQSTFSILPSDEPFRPKHEISLVRTNGFLRQNNEISFLSPKLNSNLNQNSGFSAFQPQNFNNNPQSSRFLRSNHEGTVTNLNSFNIQQSVQPFETQSFAALVPNTRVFRSNQESSFSNNDPNEVPIGLTPPKITFFDNSFGFRNL
ncbi:transcription activator MSS11-like [Sitophilus oryzae]|uniref:Transcription activator MSS11-like n=1 Tax=Sitophilus oryzae TaxID=7048 RepID=A0A6J2YB94_SITOR|nr:transcription activator MSS11-like [Sitophilus oryzae]